MNIEKLVDAFSAYFQEDADIVRQIIIDNIDFVDMIEPTEDQVRKWSTRIEDSEPIDEGYESDITDEQFRDAVEEIRNNPNWMDDPDSVEAMEALARDAFFSQSLEERTATLLEMIFNLCDEIDKLKNGE